MTENSTDPDLAVEDGAFEEFARFVVGAVLGVEPDGVIGPVPGDDAGSEVPAEGSALAGEGGDALYTLPDGSISFSGTSGFGDTYSFDAG